jgi:hypothetical protein
MALPLGQDTDLSLRQIRALAPLKLALVGPAGFEDYYPLRDQRRYAETGRSRPCHDS